MSEQVKKLVAWGYPDDFEIGEVVGDTGRCYVIHQHTVDGVDNSDLHVSKDDVVWNDELTVFRLSLQRYKKAIIGHQNAEYELQARSLEIYKWEQKVCELAQECACQIKEMEPYLFGSPCSDPECQCHNGPKVKK